MKKSALNTDIKREILKSTSRFLSILVMIALGASIFVGLTTTGPTMRLTYDTYARDQRQYDVQITSVLGLEREDRQILDTLADVAQSSVIYTTDLYVGDENTLVRLESFSTEVSIPKAVEGRLPNTADEIALNPSFKEKGVAVGDTIALIEPADTDSLNRYQFTITGFATSPKYLNSRSYGTSQRGDGSLDGYGFVIETVFEKEKATYVNLRFNGSETYDHSSKAYDEFSAAHKEKVIAAFENRPGIRLHDLKTEANTEIDDARKKIDDGKKELEEAKEKLLDARKELNKGYADYEEGKKTFEDEIQKAKNDIADGERELTDAKEKLDSGRIDYEKGVTTFKEEIAKGERDLQKGERDLADAKVALDDGKTKYADGLKTFNDEIASAQKTIDESKTKLDDAKKELDDGRAKYDDGVTTYHSEIAKAKSDIVDGENQLAASQAKLQSGEAQIAQGKIDLQLAQQRLDSGLQELQAGEGPLKEAQAQIEAGEAALSAGQAQIDAGQAELTNYKQGLLANKKEIDEGLAQIASGITAIDQGIAGIESAIAGLEASKGAPGADIPTIDAQIAELVIQKNGLTSEKNSLIEKRTALEANLPAIEAGLATIATGQSEIDKQQAALNEQKAAFQVGADAFYAQKAAYDKGMAEINAGFAALADGEKEIAANEQTIKEGWIAYHEGVSTLEQGKKTLAIEEASGAQKLADSLKALESGQKEYDEGLLKYNDGLKTFEAEKADGAKKLADAKKEIDDGQTKYDNGVKDLASGRATLEKERQTGQEALDKALNELTDGQAKYDSGLLDLEKGKRTLAEEREKGESELKDAYQKLIDGEAEYRDGVNTFREEELTAQEDIADAEKEIEKAQKRLTTLKFPNYDIGTPFDDYDAFEYVDNSRRMDVLALIFPGFFYLIALLVCLTTMTRMVDEQRTQIGTLKALGYDNVKIIRKFLVYGLISGTVGWIIGSLLGNLFFLTVIYDAYSAGTLFFKNGIIRPYPLFIGIALVLSLGCTALAAVQSTRSSLKNNAAQLMRPKSPKNGNRIAMERIGFLWSRMSFLAKITARNIFRYKKRMLMTIIGVAGCMGLIFMGFGIKDSVEGILTMQFEEIAHYDLMAIYDPNADEDDLAAYNTRLTTDERVKDSTRVTMEQAKVHLKDSPDQAISVVTPENLEKFSDFVTLRDRKSDQTISPTSDGALISEKLSWILGLKIGDVLTFEDADNRLHDVKITGIMEYYAGHMVVLSKDAYTALFGSQPIPNSDYLKLTDRSSTYVSRFIQDLLLNKAVQYTSATSGMMSALDDLIESLNVIVLVIILASSALAIVVLYNLTNINVSERIRELSTIKVLGFYPKEVTAYVYRETLLLTFIGIFIGYGLGHILHTGITTTLAPASVMMDPRVHLYNYFLSAAITMAFSVVVMIIMHRRLNRIDMVEALKGTE